MTALPVLKVLGLLIAVWHDIIENAACENCLDKLDWLECKKGTSLLCCKFSAECMHKVSLSCKMWACSDVLLLNHISVQLLGFYIPQAELRVCHRSLS